MLVTELPTFRKFLRLFDRPFRGAVGVELFRMWLHFTWIFVDAAVDPRACTDEYHHFTAEEVTQFNELMFTYFEIVQEAGFSDVLGPAYYMLGGTNERLGQVFTPMEVARLTARMLAQDWHEKLEEQATITVYDPCCGSGVLPLACAEVVTEIYGRDTTNKLEFTAQDIDYTCTLMTSLQLRMVGIDRFARACRTAGIPYETPTQRILTWVAFVHLAHDLHLVERHGADPADFPFLPKDYLEMLMQRLEKPEISTPIPPPPPPQLDRAARRRLQRQLVRDQEASRTHTMIALDAPGVVTPEALLANPTPSPTALPLLRRLALPSR